MPSPSEASAPACSRRGSEHASLEKERSQPDASPQPLTDASPLQIASALAGVDDVSRAANSAPSARDYQEEIKSLLLKADELRVQAESIDLIAESDRCLERGSLLYSSAFEQSAVNVARASEKVRTVNPR